MKRNCFRDHPLRNDGVHGSLSREAKLHLQFADFRIKVVLFRMEKFGTFGLVSSFKKRTKPPKYRYSFILLIAVIIIVLLAVFLYFLLS